MYHTLDEVVENVEHPQYIDVSGDHGYTVISDCDTDEGCFDEGRGHKGCRPLPKLPEPRSESTDTPPRSIVSASGFDSSSSMTSNSAATPNASLPRCATFCRDPTQPSDQRPQSLLSPHCLAETTQSMAFPSVLPRPHKRLVDLKDHKYMGLVKLRQDQAVFGDVTEVKLIRTLTGHLELINAEEELPAFNEYYARLLLINQTGGSLGVVGVLDTEDKPTGDSCKRPEPGTVDQAMMSPSKGAQAIHQDMMGKENPYIIYFGALSLEENVSVNLCDYLTVLDIDPKDIDSDDDGCLTMLDLNNLNVSTSFELKSKTVDEDMNNYKKYEVETFSV